MGTGDVGHAQRAFRQSPSYRCGRRVHGTQLADQLGSHANVSFARGTRARYRLLPLWRIRPARAALRVEVTARNARASTDVSDGEWHLHCTTGDLLTVETHSFACRTMTEGRMDNTGAHARENAKDKEVRYPENRVVGLLATREQLESAVDALTSGGFLASEI